MSRKKQLPLVPPKKSLENTPPVVKRRSNPEVPVQNLNVKKPPPKPSSLRRSRPVIVKNPLVVSNDKPDIPIPKTPPKKVEEKPSPKEPKESPPIVVTVKEEKTEKKIETPPLDTNTRLYRFLKRIKLTKYYVNFVTKGYIFEDIEFIERGDEDLNDLFPNARAHQRKFLKYKLKENFEEDEVVPVNEPKREVKPKEIQVVIQKNEEKKKKVTEQPRIEISTPPETKPTEVRNDSKGTFNEPDRNSSESNLSDRLSQNSINRLSQTSTISDLPDEEVLDEEQLEEEPIEVLNNDREIQQLKEMQIKREREEYLERMEKVKAEQKMKKNYRQSIQILENNVKLFGEQEDNSNAMKDQLEKLLGIQEKMKLRKSNQDDSLEEEHVRELNKLNSLKVQQDYLEDQISSTTNNALMLLEDKEKEEEILEQNSFLLDNMKVSKKYLDHEYFILRVDNYKKMIKKKIKRVWNIDIFAQTIREYKIVKKKAQLTETIDATQLRIIRFKNDVNNKNLVLRYKFDTFKLICKSVKERNYLVESLMLLMNPEKSIWYSNFFNIELSKRNELNEEEVRVKMYTKKQMFGSGKSIKDKSNLDFYVNFRKNPIEDINIYTCTWHMRDRRPGNETTMRDYFFKETYNSQYDYSVLCFSLQQVPKKFSFSSYAMSFLEENKYIPITSSSYGDIQQYIFVKSSLANNIVDICTYKKKIMYKKKGLENGGRLKGGVACSFTYNQTSLLFMNVKLFEEDMKQDSTKGLDFHKKKFIELISGFKIGASTRGTFEQFDFAFIMGNLNFKIKMKLYHENDLPNPEEMCKNDELLMAQQKGFLSALKEPKIKFAPNIFEINQKGAYSDRILHFDSRSLSHSKEYDEKEERNCVNLFYKKLTQIKSSQNCPISAAYQIKSPIPFFSLLKRSDIPCKIVFRFIEIIGIPKTSKYYITFYADFLESISTKKSKDLIHSEKELPIIRPSICDFDYLRYKMLIIDVKNSKSVVVGTSFLYLKRPVDIMEKEGKNVLVNFKVPMVVNGCVKEKCFAVGEYYFEIANMKKHYE